MKKKPSLSTIAQLGLLGKIFGQTRLLYTNISKGHFQSVKGNWFSTTYRKWCTSLPSSVTRFGEIPPLWPIFKIFSNIFKVYLVLGKVFSSLWYNLYTFGQIFIAENGKMLKTQSGRLVTLLPRYVQSIFYIKA